MSQDRPIDICVSYAREDVKQVERLVRALETVGDWRIWWDRRLRGGTLFDEEIERQLRAARCVLVVWSRAAAVSRWVKAEAEVAVERGVLLAISLDGAPAPFQFRPFHTRDLSRWTGVTDAPFEALVADIESVVPSMRTRATDANGEGIRFALAAKTATGSIDSARGGQARPGRSEFALKVALAFGRRRALVGLTLTLAMAVVVLSDGIYSHESISPPGPSNESGIGGAHGLPSGGSIGAAGNTASPAGGATAPFNGGVGTAAAGGTSRGGASAIERPAKKGSGTEPRNTSVIAPPNPSAVAQPDALQEIERKIASMEAERERECQQTIDVPSVYEACMTAHAAKIKPLEDRRRALASTTTTTTATR